MIRPADLSDLDILLDFEQAMIETERAFDPTIRTGPDVRYYDLENLITSPNVELLVAELGGWVIGCGYARIDTSDVFLKHRKHSYLGFMFVAPEHRGRGINRLIVDALEEWSRSRGVLEMKLEVYIDNASAIKAYERSGYEGLILQMWKHLM